MLARIGVALVSTLALSVVLVSAQDAEKDLKKIEGTWRMVSGSDKGKPIPAEALEKVEMLAKFKGNTYELHIFGKKVESGTIKVDTKKKPMYFDSTVVEGKDDEKGKTQLGIFEMKGDKLRILLGLAGAKERPKSFEDAKEESFSLIEMKKVSK